MIAVDRFMERLSSDQDRITKTEIFVFFFQVK